MCSTLIPSPLTLTYLNSVPTLFTPLANSPPQLHFNHSIHTPITYSTSTLHTSFLHLLPVCDKYDNNRQNRRTVRSDIPLARSVQEEEHEHLRLLQEQQDKRNQQMLVVDLVVMPPEWRVSRDLQMYSAILRLNLCHQNVYLYLEENFSYLEF